MQHAAHLAEHLHQRGDVPGQRRLAADLALLVGVLGRKI